MNPRVRGVVATAGHVDHGKTSLVRALTGVDVDRLPEEKARGITIDLGFAHWETSRMSASIVDVPGHERFVGTMVAGAAGIDAVLLVVAADDGVMPQTREHVAICEHLGVARGVIAITKIDAVDAELLELVEADVREAVRGTFLEHARVIGCSSRTGAGLDTLADAACDALDRPTRTRAARPVWLPIDRVFGKHGHGTIVTGTLARGDIDVDDALDLVTSDGISRVSVRGIEVHGRAVTSARAGSRVALNLRGAERDAVRRGAVLATTGWQWPTRSIDVAVTLDGEARGELSFHLGTAHRTARATMLTGAGRSRLARLTFDTPLATYAGERFVLRRAFREGLRTIGGGEVIDPHPALPRPKKCAAIPPRDPRSRLLAIASERAAGVSRRSLVARLAPEVELAPIVSRLVREGALVEATDEDGTRWVAAAELDRAKLAVRAAIVAHHREHPALGGATVNELSGRVPTAWRALVPMATAALVREGAIAGGDRVAAIGHDASALADRVHEIYRAAGLSVIDETAARAISGLPERTFRDVVSDLARSGRVERLAEGVHVDRAALDEIAERVRAWLVAHDALSPGEFKSLSGLTRKHAIAILEWLDRHGITRRKGDVRVRA